MISVLDPQPNTVINTSRPAVQVHPLLRGGSFLWGGFEATNCLRSDGVRLDLLRSTEHDRRCDEDYLLLKELFGVNTVRESLSWAHIEERRGTRDFARFESMMRSAEKRNINQIWALTHFGFPDWVGDIVSDVDEFSKRFAEYAVHATSIIRKYQGGDVWITPLNEGSFLSWIAGDEATWMPFLRGRGLALKIALCRACVAAIRAMRQEYPQVRFMHTDPLMYRVPRDPCDQKAAELAEGFHDARFEWLDMLMGFKFPELGGCPECVDVVALNYYSHNQQEVVADATRPSGYHFVRIPLEDETRVPLSTLLTEVYERYGKDLVIGEFGHYIETHPFYRDQRVLFCDSVFDGMFDAAMKGVPIRGACHYPVIDYQDWFDGFMHYSGMLDERRRPYAELRHSLVENTQRFISA